MYKKYFSLALVSGLLFAASCSKTANNKGQNCKLNSTEDYFGGKVHNILYDGEGRVKQIQTGTTTRDFAYYNEDKTVTVRDGGSAIDSFILNENGLIETRYNTNLVTPALSYTDHYVYDGNGLIQQINRDGYTEPVAAFRSQDGDIVFEKRHQDANWSLVDSFTYAYDKTMLAQTGDLYRWLNFKKFGNCTYFSSRHLWKGFQGSFVKYTIDSSEMVITKAEIPGQGSVIFNYTCPQ